MRDHPLAIYELSFELAARLPPIGGHGQEMTVTLTAHHEVVG